MRLRNWPFAAAAFAGPALLVVPAALVSGAGCGSDETGTAPTADAAPDVAFDAFAADTSPDLDTSAPDTGLPDVMSGMSFCGALSEMTPQPRFCDDFDDHNIPDHWDTPELVGTGTELGDDGTTYVSPTASLIASTKAFSASVTPVPTALLRTTLADTVTHPKLQFQLKVSQSVFTDGGVCVANLDVSTEHRFFLWLCDPLATTACSPTLQENVPGTNQIVHHPLMVTAVPPVNTWVNTTIDLDLSAGLANVSFGNTPALVNEPITAQAGTEATIRIGALFLQGPLPDFTANFDNVVLYY